MDKNKKHAHHLVPLSVYVKTIIALLILTVVTVGASYIDFGAGNIFVALGIASLKASLVMMFFMGLKYDHWLNRAVIGSSFVGLFLFFFFCAADLWTRKQAIPAAVHAVATSTSAGDLKALSVSTPELVSKGKELFDNNCAVCHGAQGNGDGAGGMALNPKPRNFHAPLADWKFGNTAESIFGTLFYGSAGTGMASYKESLSVRDRFALAHYIASLSEGQKADKAPARYEAALKAESGGGAAGSAKNPIPVDFAIDRMLQEGKK